MPAPMLRVGEITIIPLSDGTFTPPHTGFMPSVSAEQWEPVREFLNQDGTVPLNFGCWLISEGGQWTLVDTGFGPGAQSPGGRLLGELEKAKLTPDQIARVIITHLHVDHVGYNTVERDGKREVVFRNARHIVQQRDWDYWTQPDVKKANPVVDANVEPLKAAGVLDLIDGDATISPGISALFTPGHTPGHMSVLVTQGDEKAIIIGDVAHTPAQVTNAEWCPEFDQDKPLATKTRMEVWDRIEQQGLKVCAGHFPYPSLGGIVRVEGKRRWQAV